MKNQSLLITGFILILAAVLGAVYLAGRTPAPAPGGEAPATKGDLITVTAPLPNATVTSPLTVSGKARGNWYFEASFPVRLLDGTGRELAVVPAEAQGDWMTTEYVPFSVALTFAPPTTSTGTLVLEKDNPSGLPENAAELRIPITFREVATTTARTLKLYFYDAARDQGPGGAQCSAQGLVAVERSLPTSQTPLRDAIDLLLRGSITADERARGLTTEFPLAGVTLRNATIVNGVATLTFDDPQGKTSGGSCRVRILASQIEATAKQFPTVTSVRLLPEELFQP